MKNEFARARSMSPHLPGAGNGVTFNVREQALLTKAADCDWFRP